MVKAILQVQVEKVHKLKHLLQLLMIVMAKPQPQLLQIQLILKLRIKVQLLQPLQKLHIPLLHIKVIIHDE